MTAFGRGEAALGPGVVTAEVRTVNSRHLDLRIRLPRECTELEPVLRSAVSRHFARGQVEVTVRLPEESSASPEVGVNLDTAARYVEVADALRKQLGIEGALSIETLLGLPEVVQLRQPELPASELAQAVCGAAEQACEAAAQMRRREGEALETEFSARLVEVQELVTRIGERTDEITEGLRERLRRRLATLAPEAGVDPARLAQEVVFYADRMDVTEELVRLGSHLAQFRESLSVGGPVGRKLEFLLQELTREANTIGSKASDGQIPTWVVELKTGFEKLREQVLNVE
jgi:uncharacterized protein (TIGR00255 family)